MTRGLPSAPLVATGMLAGYGVVVATGSRALGGLVLAVFGITCIAIWLGRDGRAATLALTGVGLAAFALSHVLGLVIGAWPAVVIAAALASSAAWRWSDSGARRLSG